MATFYELDEKFKEAIDMYDAGVAEVIDTETGEVIEIGKYIASLEIDIETKLDNTALFLKELVAQENALKEEIKRLNDRKKAKENTIESLKRLLANALGGKKRETAQYSISFRKSESITIAEGAVIPDEFLIEQEPKVDKVGLKKAIKAGAVIEGVNIEAKNNIQVK